MRAQIGPQTLDNGIASHRLRALVALIARAFDEWPRLMAHPTPPVPPIMLAKGRSESSDRRG
ncbi:MAG: hypothetical protein M3Y74_15005, partial [Chloroflexota bacterium]|nr:hypothetical protein [Chloroflexota bacterium]